ncbi:hypothetical protein ABZ733_24215, partial [Streptomyces longwoodensis]
MSTPSTGRSGTATQRTPVQRTDSPRLPAHPPDAEEAHEAPGAAAAFPAPGATASFPAPGAREVAGVRAVPGERAAPALLPPHQRQQRRLRRARE